MSGLTTPRGPGWSRQRPITVILEDQALPYPYQSGDAFNELDRSDVARLRRALTRLAAYRFVFLDRHDALLSELAARRPSFVFNLCDTGFRNQGALEGHIPALLDILGLPYSGAAPAGLVLCRDKALVRAAAAGLGVPVPQERYLEAGSERLDGFRYPAILKPNLEDGSRAIGPDSVVDGPAAAAASLRLLREELGGEPMLLQEFLPGAEFSVGLVGNPRTGFLTLPPSQVDWRRLDPALPRILAFDFKTDPTSAYWRQISYRRADLEAPAINTLVRHSERLFERLECRDYARFDFRTGSDGRIKLLEVNPNPAWVWKGGLHSMAAFAGFSYPEFLGLLLEAALARTGVGLDELQLWRPGRAA